MTGFLAPPEQDGWTVADLADLPDDGLRYELIDGSLLVSPAPHLFHVRSTNHLHNVLARKVPTGFEVGQGAGLTIDGNRTYLIPDLFVVHASAYERDDHYLTPADCLIVVEVLSPTSTGRDLVLKRHYYAGARVPRYWLVDHVARTLTVLTLDGEAYREAAVVAPGTAWRTDDPFPLTLDPAEFL